MRRVSLRAVVIGLLSSCCIFSAGSARPLFDSRFHGFTIDGTLKDLTLADLNADGELDFVAIVIGSNKLIVRLGDAEGDFAPPLINGLAQSPAALAVGSLNGDSHVDAAVLLSNGTCEVFPGNGDGTFGTSFQASVGGGGAGIALGDLNEDGKTDLVVTSQSAQKATILYGFLPTFFFPTVDVPSGIEPTKVAMQDVNGDENLDLVILNRGSNNIQVHLGDGSGALAPATIHSGVATMEDLRVGDLTGDGRVDLVVSASGLGGVLVYAGNPAGTFDSPTTISVGATPRQIVLGHLDANSTLDLVATRASLHGFSVLLGQGGGAFAPPVDVASSVAAALCVAGDLNGDARLDLLVGGTSGVAVHRGNGDGSFGIEANTYAFAPDLKSVTVADLDLDNIPDLAVTSFDALSILIGQGDGTFASGPVFSFAAQARPRSVAVGDLDEDGLPDLVTANVGAGELAVFHGAGGGAFTPAGTITLAGGPHAIAIVDLNGDQNLDLLVLKRYDLDVLLGNGNGTFAPASSHFAAQYYSSNLGVADVDLDGALDAVISQGGCCPGGYWLLRGNGDGSFAAREPIYTHPTTTIDGSAAGVARLDADALPDVAFVNASASSNRVYSALGNGDGTFDAPLDVGAAFDPRSLDIADVDGDGFLDLVIGNLGTLGTTSVHLGRGDGSFGTRLDFGIAGKTCFVRAADLNLDGATDLVAADFTSPKIWVLLNQRVTPTSTVEPELQPAAGFARVLRAYEMANGTVRIEYSFPAVLGSSADLGVYDARGRLVRSFSEGLQANGMRRWDRSLASGARAPRGVYFVRLRAGEAAPLVRKVPLLRP